MQARSLYYGNQFAKGKISMACFKWRFFKHINLYPVFRLSTEVSRISFFYLQLVIIIAKHATYILRHLHLPGCWLHIFYERPQYQRSKFHFTTIA